MGLIVIRHSFEKSNTRKMKAILSLISSLLILRQSFAKLVVYGPEELRNEFGDQKPVIKANYANFGHIPYG